MFLMLPQDKVSAKKISSKYTENIQYVEYYEEALLFFVDKLIPDNFISSITIEYYDGLIEDHGYQSCILYKPWFVLPTKYTILIDPTLSLRQMLIALAHEAIHIKQYYTGELKEMISFTVWKNQIWYSDVLDVSNEEYNNFPWEQEAFSKENDLNMAFLRHKMVDS